MSDSKFSKIAELAAKAKQEKAEKAQLEAEKAAAEKQEKHAERSDVENQLAESTTLLEQRNNEITQAEAIVADLGEETGEIAELLEGLKAEAQEIAASIAELTARKEALDAELGTEGETDATTNGTITETTPAEAEETAEKGPEQSMEEKIENILGSIEGHVATLTEIPEDWKPRIQEALVALVTDNVTRQKEKHNYAGNEYSFFDGTTGNILDAKINPEVAQYEASLDKNKEDLRKAEAQLDKITSYIGMSDDEKAAFSLKGGLQSVMPEFLHSALKEENIANNDSAKTEAEKETTRKGICSNYAEQTKQFYENQIQNLQNSIAIAVPSLEYQKKVTFDKYKGDIAKIWAIRDTISNALKDALTEKKEVEGKTE